MRIPVGGQVFDVHVEGPPEAQAVLLLHGFPQSAHAWRHVLPYLSEFRVIAPDQRGYSPDARPETVEEYRIGRLVEDALGLLDALGVGRAHVVGHDWGAALAWQLAARCSSRIRTLTAVSVPHPRAFLHALETDQDQRERSQYMRQLSQPGYDQVLLADGAAGLRLLFGQLPSEVDIEHIIRRAQEPGALASWLRWYAAQRREDLADTPAVSASTLHVWSDQDAALGRVGALATADWVTGLYHFKVLEGVSHWIPEEAADQLGPLLVEHLNFAS